MSRIHEALKRAEQEKAAAPENRLPVEHTAALAEIVEESTPAPVLSKPVPVDVPKITTVDVPKITTSTLPKDLRFDDLRERCLRPPWKPDPRLLVFGNSHPFAAGAEQFRTLRSRLYKIRDSQPPEDDPGFERHPRGR